MIASSYGENIQGLTSSRGCAIPWLIKTSKIQLLLWASAKLLQHSAVPSAKLSQHGTVASAKLLQHGTVWGMRTLWPDLAGEFKGGQ